MTRRAMLPLRVMVLGVRGIPDVPGGIETHAAELYPRLAALGCDVQVLVRSPFVPRGLQRFSGVRITRLWSPRRPGLEAMIHSLIGVGYAAVVRPDVLHIHAVGPAIVTPIARLCGLRVVVTHHGPDYEREKWGKFARFVLRSGERAAARCAQEVIVISRVIAEHLRIRYGRESILIPNGVNASEADGGDEHVRRLGLVPGRYFLLVARIVPEKRQLDLIQAFVQTKLPGWKLALAGALTPDAYSQEVSAAAARCQDVVLAGFVRGQPLQQLYANAGAFVLPSSHEGLPIALLEAMSYGLPALASNIPANLEVGLPAASYFPVGDIGALTAAMTDIAAAPADAAARTAVGRSTVARYDWDEVARQTMAVYARICADRR